MFTPNHQIVKEKISKLVGEGMEGSFGVLPKHVDFVTKIIASILSFTDEEGEGYLAIDEGIMVKIGEEVRLSAREALESRNLEELQEQMIRQFQQSQEEDQRASMELTRLEFGIIKSFYDLKESSE